MTFVIPLYRHFVRSCKLAGRKNFFTKLSIIRGLPKRKFNRLLSGGYRIL